MFAFFRKKTMSSIAVYVLLDLIMCKILKSPIFGRTAEEISKTTGLTIFATLAMLNKLIEYNLVKELRFSDSLYYQADNIPEDFDVTTYPATIITHIRKKVKEVDFSDI
ncbi:hypothetical protein VHTUMSATKI_37760 [Vibrio harveyi]|uniref:hypothetical protein n=1 Tax=Vibrio harveyi TaxID=669 RepID=UPI0027EA7AB9|nr:hypothetical protein [Vibrio harveyi]